MKIEEIAELNLFMFIGRIFKKHPFAVLMSIPFVSVFITFVILKIIGVV